MKRIKLFLIAALFLFSALFVAGCKKDNPPQEEEIKWATIISMSDLSVEEDGQAHTITPQVNNLPDGYEVKADGEVSFTAAGTHEIKFNVVKKADNSVVFTVKATLTITTKQNQGDQITRLTPFVTVLASSSNLREYRDGIDHMINDFSADTADSKSYLKVLVDETANPAPTTGDAAIYKIGTNVFDLPTFAGLGFKMRVVEGNLPLENLVLALRGADAYQLYEINLADAVDPDGDPLPALTNEFQDIIVCPQLSIEDDTTEYLLADGTKSGVTVLSTIVGMHLYLKGQASAKVEIAEVFGYQTEKHLMDNFNRYEVGAGDSAVCWWRGSTGFSVPQGTTQGLTVSTADLDGKANLVITALGDASGVKINNKSWSELKDNEGHALAMPVDGKFYSFVINLEQSGLTGDLNITNDGKLIISQVFSSNLETKTVVTEYPLISKEYINMFDDFNREQTGFDGDYDKSSTNPIVTGAGLNYALCYSGNGDKITIANGVVTFDATDLGNGYIAFKEGKNNYDGEPYLVLVLKATDGATFNDFRFNVGNGVVYYHDMYSAYGLHLPAANATNYPYTDENGFMWVVIDLAESGMNPVGNDEFIEFFYSGTGKLIIDAAFYAQGADYVPDAEYEDAEYINTTVALDNYAYVGWFDGSKDSEVVKLILSSSDEGVTLKSFRFGDGKGAEKWFKDELVKDSEGNVISADTAITAEGITVIVNIAESGMADWTDIHFHAGGFDGATGSVLVKGYLVLEKEAGPEYEDAEYINTTVALDNYAYVGWFDGSKDSEVVKLILSSSDEGVTLKSFRFGDGKGAEKWFKDELVKDSEGNVISADTAITAEGITVIVNIAESGMADWTDIHFHAGGFDGATGSVLVKGYLVLEVVSGDTTPYQEIIATFADEI